MAPFKLKFRMGSSRSTSQEVDVDPQANQSLLTNATGGIGISSSTIDSADCSSLTSLGNDQRSLLPNNQNGERLGYLNPVALHSTSNSLTLTASPPTYEHVLEQDRQRNFSSNSLVTTGEGGGDITNFTMNESEQGSTDNLSNTCTDPDCTEMNNQECGNRRKSIDHPQYLTPTMTTPTCQKHRRECTGSCDPLLPSPGEESNTSGGQSHHHQCDIDEQSQEGQSSHHCQESQDYLSNEEIENCSEEDWNSHQGSIPTYRTEITTSEIISNKSSKEIYKAVAKQWGITCKMSEQCRCMECQSHYFDCEFDENEHQKTDGGLGAGTPMFISEVMHGSACTIL